QVDEPLRLFGVERRYLVSGRHSLLVESDDVVDMPQIRRLPFEHFMAEGWESAPQPVRVTLDSLARGFPQAGQIFLRGARHRQHDIFSRRIALARKCEPREMRADRIEQDGLHLAETLENMAGEALDV